MLRGREHAQNREDIVATAISQTVTGFLEKNPLARNAIPEPGDLEGMMKTIVRRRVLDHHRRQFRRPTVPFDERAAGKIAAALPPSGNDDRAEALWLVIATLDPPLPDLFGDRFLLGWTTAEIARRRGMNPNTVLSHFHRGIARLREQFADPDA